MKTHEILEAVVEKEDKYFDLVAYARKSPEMYETIPKVKEMVDKIRELYPAEVADLGGKDSDWTHGFNSGMLAGMRYVLTLFSEDKETAEEDFPFLDT
ncbi:MAG: hypothetical protein RLZZ546_975 [Bacteroidota bacterium]|jgi:hypothetical protein